MRTAIGTPAHIGLVSRALWFAGALVLLALGTILLAACDKGEEENPPATPIRHASVGMETPAATHTPIQPTATPTPPPAGVRLLFAYSLGCPHSAYERPIISEFEKRHAEVDVMWVTFSDLNSEQRKLIEGTTGRPVMVFFSGDHVRQVVGETSLKALEAHYEAFGEQLGTAQRSRTTIPSGGRCY